MHGRMQATPLQVAAAPHLWLRRWWRRRPKPIGWTPDDDYEDVPVLDGRMNMRQRKPRRKHAGAVGGGRLAQRMRVAEMVVAAAAALGGGVDLSDTTIYLGRAAQVDPS